MPDGENLDPLFDVLLDAIPAPEYDPEAPLQAQVTNLDASPFLGRLALCRIYNGTIRKGQQVAWMQGTTAPIEQRQDHRAAGHRRRSSACPAESAGAGDIVAVAGIPDIMIGDTLADPDDPRAAAADHRRRAGDLDDHRHQHLAAGRQGPGTS